MTRRVRPLDEDTKNEIARFEREIKNVTSGKMDPDDFKKFRLNNGIYGIRGSDDTHMVRIKVPYGVMEPDQLDAVAGAAHFAVTDEQALGLQRQLQASLPGYLVPRLVRETPHGDSKALVLA